MTKAELVAIMAKNAGGSKTSAERAMNAFVSGIIESLRRGRRVTISGFGTFVVTRRAARNDATRAPARRSRFPRPSPSLPPEPHAQDGDPLSRQGVW